MDMKGTTGMLAAALVATLALAPGVAVGQGAPAAAAKIGFVNVGAALRAMPGYAQAESLYVKESTSAQQELQAMQASLDSAVAAFQQQSPMLSPTNRTARETALRQQNDRLQQRGNDLRQRLAAREEELLSPMQDRLTAIIDGLRAENNLSLILDIGGQAAALIVSYDKSLDLTSRVLQRIAQTPGN